MERIILYGNTRMAPVLTEYMERNGHLEVIGFCLHEKFIDQRTIYDRPVIAFENLEEDYPPSLFQLHIVFHASPTYSRAHLMNTYQEAHQKGYQLYNYIDPEAWVAESVVIGDNCCLLRGASVEPLCRLGNGVFLQAGAFVGYGTQIGNFSRIGAMAVINNNNHIAPEAVIDPGAVI